MDLTQFFAFLLAGGTAAASNIVSRYLFNFIMPFEVAVLFAYFVGMIVAFVLTKRYVFEADGSIKRQMTRFLIVNLVSLIAVWTTSVSLANVLFPFFAFDWYAKDIAHLIGVMVPAIISYFGHKNYTFSNSIN